MHELMLFASERPDAPTKVFILVDAAGLSELIVAFERLARGDVAEAHVSHRTESRAANCPNVAFKRSAVSRGTLTATELIVQAHSAALSKYIGLAAKLLESDIGHQYLDCESIEGDFELLLSAGEYPQGLGSAARLD